MMGVGYVNSPRKNLYSNFKSFYDTTPIEAHSRRACSGIEALVHKNEWIIQVKIYAYT